MPPSFNIPGAVKYVGLSRDEISLSGEIRSVPNGEERLKEAATHGFKRAIVPKANMPKKGRVGELEVIGVERLAQAIDACR